MAHHAEDHLLADVPRLDAANVHVSPEGALQNALWDLGWLGQTRLNPAHRTAAKVLLAPYP